VTVKELRKLLKRYPPLSEISFQYYPNVDEGWECNFDSQNNLGYPPTVSLFFTPKEYNKR